MPDVRSQDEQRKDADELVDKLMMAITDHVLAQVDAHDVDDRGVRRMLRFALSASIARIVRSGLDPDLWLHLEAAAVLLERRKGETK